MDMKMIMNTMYTDNMKKLWARLKAVRVSLRTLNMALATAAVVLVALCVASVCAPMRFDRERAYREAVVKQRLLVIRAAAEKYRARTGAYTASFAALTHSCLLPDSVQYIPYSGGRRFRLAASAVVTPSGKMVPVMECSASYADYLSGLDANAIRNITYKAEAAGRFAGLKIGDMDTPGDNAGNWE